MNWPTIAAPLAGRVMGSTDNNFVVAEWRDPGALRGRRGPSRHCTSIIMTTKRGTSFQRRERLIGRYEASAERLQLLDGVPPMFHV
jgi:hypothetical protein